MNLNKRLFALSIGLLALAACNEQALTEQGLTEQARIRTAARAALESEWGGVVADCAIRAATPNELRALAVADEGDLDSLLSDFYVAVKLRHPFRTCLNMSNLVPH